MKELIDAQQAQHLMLGILILAPVLGLIIGAFAKNLVRGFVIGLLIGGGNFALWTVYNAITNRLGLDTAHNLVVNLILFAVVGILGGVGAAWYTQRQDRKEKN